MCKIKDKQDDIILELKNLTYTYEGERRPVWESLSCVFYRGKIHAISGPSGCGKSSILNLIDGLIPHMYEGDLKGQVLLEGKDITKELPRYRCEYIGFVMQNPESQFCTFTVEEELAFGMENLGISRHEMKQRITEVLRFINMEGYEERDLNSLSGGQKQKISIAAILVTMPKIILLDEPTANLDPESRRQIFQLIVKIAREENITIIIVEHNIKEIMEEVDRLLLLDANGHTLLDCARGTPEELAWRHQSDISAVNVIQTEHRSFKETVVKISDLHFAYPVPGKKRQKGTPVIRGIDLEIYRQDFLAIIGNNGVGKSTLMRLLFKINRPDQGKIEVFGRDLKSCRTKELYQKMGLVFQNPENQFIANTVQDEMLFSLRRVRISDKEKKARVDDMLKRFRLENEKEKNPFILSQGQKRRLSVASMLLTDQQLLFLDEPTYGQDFENRQELMKDMQMLADRGITIVMITHDLSLVKQYATRVVEISDGKIARDIDAKSYFLNQEAI